MKKYQLIILVIILFECGIYSQTNSDYKYKIEIESTLNSLDHNRCLIKSFSDSSIIISKYYPKFDPANTFITTEYYFNDINSFQIRHRNSILHWAVGGAILGFIIGAAIPPDNTVEGSYGISYSIFDSEKDARIMQGIAVGAIGGTVGAFIGTAKITIPLDEKYFHKKGAKKLQKYRYK